MLRRAGEAFAAIRNARGLTQAELARAARLHVNTVSNIERGTGEPSILALGLLCLELGCARIDFDDEGFLPVPGEGTDPSRLPPGMRDDEEAMAVHQGARIRERRLAAGMGLQELARAAAVHPNTLRNFERGRAALSVLSAYRIYRVLGIPYVDGSGGPDG